MELMVSIQYFPLDLFLILEVFLAVRSRLVLLGCLILNSSSKLVSAELSTL
jgi:hypothetical protein